MSVIHETPDGQRAVIFRTITSFGADVDLTTQSGAPPWNADRVEVHNDEATTQDIVIRGADATNVTIEVPADSIRVINAPVFAIEATGTQTIASVTAYWHYDGSRPLNA
jgi:hypothetical protein